MEVSNTTGGDTETRTASGNPRYSTGGGTWVLVKAGKVVTMPDPPCPFTIEFRVGKDTVSAQTCETPLRRVTLVKPGRSGKYQVRRFKQPPQPPRPSVPDGYGPRPSQSRA